MVWSRSSVARTVMALVPAAAMLALGPACFSLSLDATGTGGDGGGAPADAGGDTSVGDGGVKAGAAEDLAVGQQTPRNILVDASHVYWLNLASGGSAGAIMKVAKGAGAGAPQIVVPNLAMPAPYAIAADATSLFWTTLRTGVGGADYAFLRTQDKAGGAISDLGVLANASYFGVTVQGGRVYATTERAGGAVETVGTDGTGATAIGAGLLGTVIAVDATDIYVGGTGQVLQQSKAGGSPVLFAKTSGVVTGLVIDATSVYWTDASSVRGLAKTAAGTAPTELAAAQDAPSAIALDDANVYWTNAGDGRVQSVPKGGVTAGEKPTVIATGEGEPMGIAADSSGVYWTNRSDGRVRVARR